MDLEKNDIIEGKIENQGNSGEGVLRYDKFPIFVDYGLKDEDVRVKILRINNTHGFGKIISFNSKSENRQEPPCPYYYECGGCQLQHMNYKTQLEFKKQRVEDVFTRIGGFSDIKVEDTIGLENPFYYRNKVQLPVGKKDDEVELGFYKVRSHSITNIDECLIQKEIFNKIMASFRKIIRDNDIPIFSEDKKIGKGQIRHLLLRTSKDESEVMVVPVFTSNISDDLKDKIVSYLTKEFKEIKSIILNINDRKGNTILGNRNITIFGKDTIIDHINEYQYEISPHSFFQVNPPMTEVMYQKAVEFSKFNKEDIVFDLYCGAGTISMFVSKYVKKVYGIEIVEPAILDARENAKRNNVENAEFILGKAEEKIDELLNRNIKPDVVILDPPRKGCEESLLKKLGELKVPKITYISCNPATQARDAKILAEFGYKLEHIQPVDNFPMTSHVETVTLMSLK